MTFKLSNKTNWLVASLMFPLLAQASIDVENYDKKILTTSVMDEIFPERQSPAAYYNLAELSSSDIESMAKQFEKLSPEQKQALTNKLKELSPQEQKQAAEFIKNLTPQQQSQILSTINSLNPEQQKQINDAIKQLPIKQQQEITKSVKELPTQQQQQIAKAIQQAALAQQKSSSQPRSSQPEDEVTKMQKAAAEAQNKNRNVTTSGISEVAFKELLNSIMPLSPEQIITLRKLYDISQQAAATTPKAPPTPISSSTVISLEPGNLAPVIRLAAGFVTSLVITDSTGTPWPIAAYSIGDPKTFNIQWDKKTNTMFLQAQKNYSHGNLAIQLHELNTPVMISLVSGQREVDFRVDLQVQGRGPDAKAPVVPDTGLQSAQINPVLISLLDGIPPKNSTKLEVSGYNGEAWLYKDKLYFRTKLTVLSPAWIATISSPDGTNVYEMIQTPLILASKDGKTVNVQLVGL